MDLKDPVLTALANRCLNLTIPDPQSALSSVRGEQTPNKRRHVSPFVQFSTRPPTPQSNRPSHQRRPTPLRAPRGQATPLRDPANDYGEETASRMAKPDFPILEAEHSMVSSVGGVETRVVTEPAVPTRMSPQPISPPACRNRSQRAKTPPPEGGGGRCPNLVSVECMSPPPPNQLSWYARPRGAQRRKIDDSSPSVASNTCLKRKVPLAGEFPYSAAPPPLAPSHLANKVTIIQRATHQDLVPADRPITQSTDPTETYVEPKTAKSRKPSAVHPHTAAPPLAPPTPQPLPPKPVPGGAKLREPQTLGKDLNAFASDGPTRPNHLEYQKSPGAPQESLIMRKAEANFREVRVLSHGPMPPQSHAPPPPPPVEHSSQLEASGVELASRADMSPNTPLGPSAPETPSRIRRRDTVMIRHHQQDSPPARMSRVVRPSSPKHPPPLTVVPVKSAPLPGDLLSNVSSEAAGVTSMIQRFESSALKPVLPPSAKMGSGPGDLRKSFREKLDAFRAMERQLSNDSFSVSRATITGKPSLRKQNTMVEPSSTSSRRLGLESAVPTGLRHPSGSLTARAAAVSPSARRVELLQKVDHKLVEAMRACHTFYDAHNAVKEIAQEAGDLIRLIDSQGNVLCSREVDQSTDTSSSMDSSPRSSERRPSGRHMARHQCLVHSSADPYAYLRHLLNRNSPTASRSSSHSVEGERHSPPSHPSISSAIRELLFPATTSPVVQRREDLGLRNALTSGLHRNCTGASPDIATYTLSHVDTLGILSILHQQQLLIQTLVRTTMETTELMHEMEPSLDLENKVSCLLESLKKKI